MLLRAAVGNISVRQFLGELDGCTGSGAQSRIAAQFLRRSADSLDAVEAAELLAAAQAATKPPKPKALRPLGRHAVVAAGYAIAEGTFTEGEHAPRAESQFLVECWADVFALNRSLTEEMPLTVAAAGFPKLTVKQALQLCDPDLKAANSKAQPDRIAPKPLTKVKVAGEKLDAMLPPASWNVIQLAVVDSEIPPHSYGEVSASYADGGVIGEGRDGASDPSVADYRRHLPI